MREKINSFNAAFVDLAAAYVQHIANKVAGNTTYTPEPSSGPLRWGMSLADEIRVANLLAATIGKMQATSGGELPQGSPADDKPHAADNLEFLRDFLEGKTRWTFPEGTTINVAVDASGTSGMETTQKGAEKEPPAGPEPVTLGPGAYFRLENTTVSRPCVTVDGVNVDVLPVLNNLCGFCRAAAKYGGVTPEREWAIDAAALEFAISVLSELEGMKEVRISAAPEKETELWRMIREAGPGMIVNLPAEERQPGAWELLRGILAGKWQAPEGCAFNVTVDASGKPLNIDPEPQPGTARAMAIAMPGGEVVKLNSAAEAYQLAGCIEKMAASVWPEMADRPAPGGPGTEKQQ